MSANLARPGNKNALGNRGNTDPVWRKSARVWLEDTFDTRTHFGSVAPFEMETDERLVSGPLALVVAVSDAEAPFHVRRLGETDESRPPLYRSDDAEHAARWIDLRFLEATA